MGEHLTFGWSLQIWFNCVFGDILYSAILICTGEWLLVLLNSSTKLFQPIFSASGPGCRWSRMGFWQGNCRCRDWWRVGSFAWAFLWLELWKYSTSYLYRYRICYHVTHHCVLLLFLSIISRMVLYVLPNSLKWSQCIVPKKCDDFRVWLELLPEKGWPLKGFAGNSLIFGSPQCPITFDLWNLIPAKLDTLRTLVVFGGVSSPIQL